MIVSGYLNIRGDPDSAGALEPVAVLIADFDNATDQSVFDGVLEQEEGVAAAFADVCSRFPALPHDATFRDAAE